MTGEETSDRSGLIAGALSCFVALTFVGAAQWLMANWAMLTMRTPPPIEIKVDVPGRGSGSRTPQIAVSTRVRYDQYDDISSVLQEMGAGYAFDPIPLSSLGDAQRLQRYKVLFMGCAAEMAPAEAPMPVMRKFEHVSLLRDPAFLDKLRNSLSSFVENGGAIYASDWASSMLELAFPRQISFLQNRVQAQHVEARVLDHGLVDLIGPRLDLTFDTDLWVVPESAGMGTAYLEGEVLKPDGSRAISPLLVSFKQGKGLVIFTSFHNEKQLSEKERALLKYLVLKPIISQAAESSQQILKSQNFTASKESLFSTGSGGEDRWFSYDAHAGQELSFVLSWNETPGDKASLKLMVKTPSGQVLEETGETPPVRVRVPAIAADGQYQYTVVPVKVPFANFPYVVTVGVK